MVTYNTPEPTQPLPPPAELQPVVAAPLVEPRLSPEQHERLVVLGSNSQVVERHTSAITRRWAFDSAICGAIGVVYAVVGLIALVRAGTDGPLSEPIVEVLGFGHTAVLGLIEIGAGIAFLLAAAMASRGAAIFFGTTVGIASFVGAIEADRFEQRLGIESSFAWCSLLMTLLVVVTALLVPRVDSQTTTYDLE